jgi:DNA excision repair protein ERCC-5
LLYFGIKPVFVFDGGAPALKRATINARKQRREGRREDATRTAGKLLALQMQRIAEEEENNRKRATHAAPQEEEEPLPDELVYAEEVFMNPQERQQNKTFRKKDQYHLPDLGVPLSEMGAPNDPRIMSLEELENYARQFDTGEDINVYDFSKIDFDGSFFLSLPPSDRYNILNAARLRSRLRMGYSKDQLDTMFPDRMAFSKFQIERVTERNDLTQRLMNLNGMNDDLMYGLDAPGRVAGERGREYVLVKNDGVEGGWALGVVTGKNDGVENKPIDVDAAEKDANEEQDEDEDNDFEDVPIEGLNRLPKATATQHEKTLGTEMARRRQAFYRSKRSAPRKRAKAAQSRKPAETEGLFVEDDQDTATEVEDEDGSASDDDEELQRAIAMSIQKRNRCKRMKREKIGSISSSSLVPTRVDLSRVAVVWPSRISSIVAQAKQCQLHQPLVMTTKMQTCRVPLYSLATSPALLEKEATIAMMTWTSRPLLPNLESPNINLSSHQRVDLNRQPNQHNPRQNRRLRMPAVLQDLFHLRS